MISVARSRGVLSIVATPIGNLDDMSYRAVQVLGGADVIAAEDTRTARRLCDHFGIHSPRVVSFFAGNEARRTEALIAELDAGHHVAVISEAGTPSVSDPGERLVRAAHRAGVRVEVIPGPSAAIAALVASGLPAARFLFVGFPPRQTGARGRFFGSLQDETATLIVYESPQRVAATLIDLVAALGAERPAALCRELTKRFEETVSGSLGEHLTRYGDTPLCGECTLVIQGADREARSASSTADDIESDMRELLDSGLGPRDAAARLVVKTGKPR